MFDCYKRLAERFGWRKEVLANLYSKLNPPSTSPSPSCSCCPLPLLPRQSINVLLSFLAKEIKRKQGTNLQEAAENESSGSNHMNKKLSRAMFGKIISLLIKKTIDP